MTTVIDEPSLETRRAQLRSDITVAARILPTHYPLETFIAVNPLAGLESMPFEQAIGRVGDLYGTLGVLDESAFRGLYRSGRITDADLESTLRLRYPALLDGPPVQLGAQAMTPSQLLRADLLTGAPVAAPQRRNLTRSEEIVPEVAELVDAQAAKWCAAFLGSSATGWPMPRRANGFYCAWRLLAADDHTLPRAVRTVLRRLPEQAEDAAIAALSQLLVADDERITYLQAHLTRLPGWAAHIRWYAGRQAGLSLLDYLAVRLAYESALLSNSGSDLQDRKRKPQRSNIPSARDRAVSLVQNLRFDGVNDDSLGAVARILSALPASARPVVWQQAYEAHYRDGLLAALSGPCADQSPRRPRAQLVCCIDTRSEGLRRCIESLGDYETYGFAGFFAVAVRFTDLLGGAPSDLCPVLIRPDHNVSEQPAPSTGHQARRRRTGAAIIAGAETAFHAAKSELLAPFVLAEATGWAAGPWAAAKTFYPGGAGTLRRRVRDRLQPPAPTVLSVNETVSLDHRALFAQVALTTMGLTGNFARLIVLCGHGSTTENNPYQAALDCGACGGQAGGPNARTAAAILNSADVRKELRTRGITIGPDTWFVAAQHDTATDQIAILDQHLIPDSHKTELASLTADLGVAGATLAAERCPVLPGGPADPSASDAARHVAARSTDWAQVFPEWGLAGNAAFIVAPRAVTREIDLHRRTFLHSYEAAVDPDGSALETILTAPMVVAQWINCQYYFSTVAPELFGAGTKTIHNVVAGAGVLAGHGGDLQLGLPRQSVTDGQSFGHEPMRLLTVIQAPLQRIDAIVERNPLLQNLFGNDWVSLAAREQPGQPWQRWTRGGWRRWDLHDATNDQRDTDEEGIPCH